MIEYRSEATVMNMVRKSRRKSADGNHSLDDAIFEYENAGDTPEEREREYKCIMNTLDQQQNAIDRRRERLLQRLNFNE